MISARLRLEATAMARRQSNTLNHSILLSQRSEFSVMRDLNYSKLALCRLQTVTTARGKVYQVIILMVCSPSKANEDSQHNSDSEVCP